MAYAYAEPEAMCGPNVRPLGGGRPLYARRSSSKFIYPPHPPRFRRDHIAHGFIALCRRASATACVVHGVRSPGRVLSSRSPCKIRPSAPALLPCIRVRSQGGGRPLHRSSHFVLMLSSQRLSMPHRQTRCHQRVQSGFVRASTCKVHRPAPYQDGQRPVLRYRRVHEPPGQAG